MSKHCCEMMRSNVENTCDVHPDRFDCADCLINFSEDRNFYGIIVHDGAGSSIVISYCPWCGHKLPNDSEALLERAE